MVGKLTARLAILIPALAILMAAGGCGGDGGFSFREATVTGTQAEGLPRPRPLEAVRVFGDISFRAPVFLTAVPGEAGLLAVVEQAGVIKVFEDREGAEALVLLDISDRVESGGEQGLIGLAFDPGFAGNGYFYVNYTASPSGATRISRFTTSAGPGGALAADAGSEEVMLEQPQPYSNHNGGMLAFGPDGYLYIALGDGGGQGDPSANAQDLSTLLGKILRIDPFAGDPYAIPPGNPFIGAAGARGEVWALGFRNPYRFSFDRATGDLWAGDVGQASREEIDLVVRGGNYGWNLFEGSEQFRNPEGRPATEFAGPVIDYGRSEGISVIGGYVYRGGGIAGLDGAYLFGDYGSGKVWALVCDRDTGAVVSSTEVAQVSGSITSFGEDARGEVYVVSLDGVIYRLEEKQR
ncbi:MAG: glucose dehydrogenase [Gaiellales bacterium]|nr:MAG: glucose dehydrogenase [Gaiellales bacterium]